METQKLLIEIGVDANAAAQSLVDQKDKVSSLKNEIKDLKTSIEAMSVSEVENKDKITAAKLEIIAKEASIKNLGKEMNTNKTIIEASTTATNDEIGAYKNLVIQHRIAEQAVKDLTTVHGVNSTEVKTAKTAFDALDTKLKEVNTSVGDNKRNVGNYTTSIIDAYNAIKAKKLALEEEKAALIAQDIQLKANKSTLDKNTVDYKENETAIENNKLALDLNKTALNQNKLELKQHQTEVASGGGGISDFADKLSSMPGALGDMGASLAAAGIALKTLFLNPLMLTVTAVAAVGAAIVAVVNNAKDFSVSVADLKAVTGFTGDALVLLKDKAIDLGTEYGIMAADVVEGMKLVASAKPELMDNAAALADVTEQAMILARASGLDMPAAVTALTTSLTMMNAGNEEAATYIDILATAAKEGKAEIPYLADVVMRVGANAHASGLDMVQLATYIEELAPSFDSPEKAATGLNNVLLNLKSQGFGFKSGDFKLTDALTELQTKLDNTSGGAEKTKLAINVFGKEGLNAGNVMLEYNKVIDGTTTAHDLLADKIQGKTGQAMKQAQDQMNTLTGDTDLMKAAWSNMMLKIDDGEGVFSNMARWAVQGITDVIIFLGNFSLKVETAVTDSKVQFAMMGAGIASFGTTAKAILGAVAESWAALKSGDVKGAINAFKDMGTNIKEAWNPENWKAAGDLKRATIANEAASEKKAATDKRLAKELKDGLDKQVTDEKAALKTRQDEIKKAQDTELKSIRDNITIKKNEYKDSHDKHKLLDNDYLASRKVSLKAIYDAEIAEIEKKKKFGKLTIEEEKIARSAADTAYKQSQIQLNADLTAEMVKQLDNNLKLEDLAQKASVVGLIQTEADKYTATIDGINKRYEAEKTKIGLTITDESDKNAALKLLDAQFNLDTKTANEAHNAAVKAQALTDEAQYQQSKYALMQDGIDKEFLLKSDALEAEKTERLSKVTAGSEAEKIIKEEYAAKEIQLEKDKQIAKAQAVADYAAKAAEILGAIVDFLNALGERELNDFTILKNAELQKTLDTNNAQIADLTTKYDADLALLDEQLASKNISEDEYKKAKEALDKEYSANKKVLDDANTAAEKKAQEEIDAKKAELEYEAGKRAKALAIVNAIINGASAVIAALATPLIGVPLAIAAGAMAALQLATIIATPIPDNRKGGSAGTSGGSITQPSVPNTTPTTNGVINEKTYGSNEVLNKQTTNTIENNSGGYVPVLVTNDLTKEYAKQNTVKVTNTME